MNCHRCDRHAEAWTPHGRVCREHAIEFYVALVRVGAGLAELTPLVDPERSVANLVRVIPSPASPEQWERLCRCGSRFTTHRVRGQVCPACRSVHSRRAGLKGGAAVVAKRAVVAAAEVMRC